MEKKLILFIFLGMFLINLASANVQVFATSTRPEFNFTLIDGNGTNDLAEGTTYYFQGIISGYGYYGGVSSPASLEYNVTTNSTHRKVNLTWDGQCDKYYFGGCVATSYNKGVLVR